MQYDKQNRRFLNTPKSRCMGAVSWHVTIAPHWDKENHRDKLCLDAEININKEATSQWVERKASMLPVYRMRDELNKFIEACEQGLEDVRNT